MKLQLTFDCKYRIDFAPHYVFTVSPKMIVNTKTSRILNQVLKNGSIGYIIDSKFYSLTKLREHLEKIPKRDTPF